MKIQRRDETYKLTASGDMEGRILFILAMLVSNGVANEMSDDMNDQLKASLPKLRQALSTCNTTEEKIDLLIISQAFFESFLQEWGRTANERRALAARVLEYAEPKGIL